MKHHSHPHRSALRWAAGIALAAFVASLSSCATTRGFGQDVKKVGNKIERSAERHM